ncbi:MAG: glucosidase [Nitrospirae bacterium]|nr:glucosidase [Nitrospirota bacterium]
MNKRNHAGAEALRLAEDARREKNWKRWGPYLSERQWGTVREDYSPGGECWSYLPHDHARSRAYRWGEDGLLGISDREGRLCFAVALWNGKDPILKERLFGLTGPEGNHGEDVKESYYYLDSTPTHSYMKALYKYPHGEFPYGRLLEEAGKRDRSHPEIELADLGVFDQGRYFDVWVEYAKADADDILIRLTIENHGKDRAVLHVLPTFWFRNTWSWGRSGEGYWPKPTLALMSANAISAEHVSLGRYRLDAGPSPKGNLPAFLFTENETNFERLYGFKNGARFSKDGFHDAVVHGRSEAVNVAAVGTKAAAHYTLDLSPNETVSLSLRLRREGDRNSITFGKAFDRVFATRIEEADAYYEEILPNSLSADARSVVRQAQAGLLWSKQFYHYVVGHWLEGDPSQPSPPENRRKGRNREWVHLYNRDVLSMPDKWEYPWYAAWDLAFHMIPFAQLDPEFAKQQLILLLREWYMHPNGQMPAYEFAFDDVNPPVHAWSCWRVYKMTGARGKRDRLFLARTFQKLLLNFTWWVNRKDVDGNNIFAGGFLGLDNIGAFDRSKPLPSGGHLEQADGTAWMAFYAATMMAMALELAKEEPAYEDVASKFFEHFVAITDAMNTLGGTGLWNEEDGFYYDQLLLGGRTIPLRVRSMVGIIPLLAVEVLDWETIGRLKGFSKRMKWFLENRKDLAETISYMESVEEGNHSHRLLAIPSRRRLERVMRYLLDEKEFLSPYGIRSLSKAHGEDPYVFGLNGDEYRVEYVPGESTTALFGGNSNWRGPIWFPLNYLLIEALERYHHFYGDKFRVECPTGSGRRMNLSEVAHELATRLSRLFLPDAEGRRPCHGDDARYARDPDWKNLVLFYEYFHGDSGKGLGASHQTGWTALVAKLFQDLARHAI